MGDAQGDSLRHEVLMKCVAQFYATIKLEGVTRSPVERRWFALQMVWELLGREMLAQQAELLEKENPPGRNPL